MRRNLIYQERYLACVRDTGGRAAEHVCTVRVMQTVLERWQNTLHVADTGYATTL
jgi:hypothetical protein